MRRLTRPPPPQAISRTSHRNILAAMLAQLPADLIDRILAFMADFETLWAAVQVNKQVYGVFRTRPTSIMPWFHSTMRCGAVRCPRLIARSCPSSDPPFHTLPSPSLSASPSASPAPFQYSRGPYNRAYRPLHYRAIAITPSPPAIVTTAQRRPRARLRTYGREQCDPIQIS